MIFVLIVIIGVIPAFFNILFTAIPVIPVLYVVNIIKCRNKYNSYAISYLVFSFIFSQLCTILFFLSPGVENEGSMKGFQETITMASYSSVCVVIAIVLLIIYIVKILKVINYNKQINNSGNMINK